MRCETLTLSCHFLRETGTTLREEYWKTAHQVSGRALKTHRYWAALRASAGNINGGLYPLYRSASSWEWHFLRKCCQGKWLGVRKKKNLWSALRCAYPKMPFTTRNYILFSPFYFLDEKMEFQIKVPISLKWPKHKSNWGLPHSKNNYI